MANRIIKRKRDRNTTFQGSINHFIEPIQRRIMAIITKSRSSDLLFMFFSLKMSQPARNPTTTPERRTRLMTEMSAPGMDNA